MSSFLKICFAFLSSGIVSDVTQYGKRRANPHACPTNNLKLDDTCECGQDAPCKDTATGAAAAGRTLVSVVFDGETYNTSTPVYGLDGQKILVKAVGPIPVEDTDAIDAWLGDIFALKEVNVYCESVWAADVLTINHTGAAALTAVTLENDDTLTITRCCDTGPVYSYILSVEGNVADLGWGGNTEELDNNPYDFTGDPVTDAATAAQLQTDVAAAMGAGNLDVPLISGPTVTVNDVNGVYDIKWDTASDEAVTSGALTATVCATRKDFIC